MQVWKEPPGLRSNILYKILEQSLRQGEKVLPWNHGLGLSSDEYQLAENSLTSLSLIVLKMEIVLSALTQTSWESAVLQNMKGTLVSDMQKATNKV